ncbi:MAG: ribbon-helix-helix domain-containing protein [Alphaproteobacteria bacterium]|nr:ribbon-helix-helix domain-containing protein [Alphaproteobacteria bacterium]
MKKHSVNIHGHQTSITLENEFWLALKDEANKEGVSTNTLIGRIDDNRGDHNLSSAIRLYILQKLQERLTA